MSSPRAKSPVFSFRTIVVAIALAGILPTLAFSGLLLLRYAESERARAERGLIESARGIARSIDAQFIAAEAMLLALRDSNLQTAFDIATFETRLRRTALETGRHFALIERDGRHVIDTSVPQGQPLPRDAPEWWAPVFTNRRSLMTDIIQAKPDGRLYGAVGVPVLQGDAVKWVLASGLFANDFAPLLNEPGVPSEWIVSIVDRTGRHIIRSHNNDRFAGRPLTPALIEHMRSGRVGAVRTMSLDEIPVLSTAQYAARSGWAAAVGLPIATLEGPIRDSMSTLMVIGAIFAAAALALAFLAARQLDHAMSGLMLAAARLGRHEVAEAPTSAVAEVNAVGTVLALASHELHDLTTSLETQVTARTAELSDTNAKLREEIRRREESEAQVTQMQKIEAIGHLTGGIAHDFNNMLAIVLGSLRLLQRRLQRGDSDVQKYIDGAVQGAERAASLTARLLAFSRQQTLAPEVIDCNNLIASMDEILRRTIPENVQIETVLAADPWPTHADAQGLENAIINLAVNARDAMPNGGRLVIETANCLLSAAAVAGQPDVEPGPYVCIAVRDTGAGMPPDVISRAFDPFFTTKPTGLGTGLGLSQVHGFVKQSGGHVEIDSELGRGTTIRLYLPRLDGDAQAGTVARPETEGIPRAADGETILVVEDEPGVRRLAVEMLRELGYATLEAEGAATALALLDAHREIDLLFTDIVMPDMDGRQLAAAARSRRPDLAVLYTTGYTRDAIVQHGSIEGIQVIAKPHTLETLAQRVSESLQARRAAGCRREAAPLRGSRG